MRFRLRQTWLWIGSGAIVAAGILSILIQDRAFRTAVADDLDLSAEIASAIVDAESLARLQADASDVGTAEYEALRGQLTDVTAIFRSRGLKGLYAMKVQGDQVLFFVDSAPVDDPWHSEPGVVYEEPPPAVLESARDRRAIVTGPYTDEYGTFYSAFQPVTDAGGDVVAVMGADIEAHAFDAGLLARRMPLAGLALLTLAVYVAVYVTVSNRQQKLSLVRQYTERLEALVGQLPVGVLIVEGRDGFVTMANDAAVRLLGKEIQTDRPADAFAETYAIAREDGTPYPSLDLPPAMALATRKPVVRAGIFIAHGDGSKTALRMAGVSIGGEDLPAAVVVLEDMTAEYELDRQKREFVSIASHELRAPLTAIRWNVDLLLDREEGTLDDGQRLYVGNIKEINDRLITLVNELLDVSRLEIGTLHAAPEETDMNRLIDEALKELSPLAKAKSLTVTNRRTPLPGLMIDPRLIRQAFTNLIGNAIKYTPEGGRVTVSAEVREGDVRFEFRDTGIGIPRAQQSQVFKKFFRAGNVSKHKIEGTGLGLYISKQAVELNGGSIGFESEEGKGAMFWVSLPRHGHDD